MIHRCHRYRLAVFAALIAPLALGACAGFPGMSSSRLAPANKAAAAPAAASAGANAAAIEELTAMGDAARAGGDLEAAVDLYRRAHALDRTRRGPLIKLGTLLKERAANDKAAPRRSLAQARAQVRTPARAQARAKAQGRGDTAPAQADRRAAPAQADRRAALAAAALAAPGAGPGAAPAPIDAPPIPRPGSKAALVVELDPRTYNGIAVTLDREGKHAAAQEKYRQGLKMDQNNLSLINNLGLSLAMAGEYAGAIRMLTRAVAHPKATGRQRRNLAWVYELSGQPEEAAWLARLDRRDDGAAGAVAVLPAAGGAATGAPEVTVDDLGADAPWAGAAPPAASLADAHSAPVATPAGTATTRIAGPAGPAARAPEQPNEEAPLLATRAQTATGEVAGPAGPAASPAEEPGNEAPLLAAPSQTATGEVAGPAAAKVVGTGPGPVAAHAAASPPSESRRLASPVWPASPIWNADRVFDRGGAPAAWGGFRLADLLDFLAGLNPFNVASAGAATPTPGAEVRSNIPFATTGMLHGPRPRDGPIAKGP